MLFVADYGLHNSSPTKAEHLHSSEDDGIFRREIHVIVSHWQTSLDSVTSITKEGFNIVSVHVISKGGYPVNGAPPGATIQVLPNVGRCDHSYVYHISNILDQQLQLGKNSNGGNAVAVFLMDNVGALKLHQPGRWNSFQDMVEVASSGAGFSCGIVPGHWYQKKDGYLASAHFRLDVLKHWKIDNFSSRNDYGKDGHVWIRLLAAWNYFSSILPVESIPYQRSQS